MDLKQKIHRPLCSDKKPMTPERIINIIRSKGIFEVSWRYRDDSLRKALRKMHKAGLIRRVRGAPGADYYKLPLTPTTTPCAPE